LLSCGPITDRAMREPGFWWRQPGSTAALLAPLGFAYGAIAAARLRRQGQRAGVPVVCIGNLTVGGAGKTPTALAVAFWLQAVGERPFFLSRGYGGRLAGPVQVALDRDNAADVGDEPLLLARVAPTIVARDRPAGAAAARASGASVIVMDDGFQNPSLAKNFSVLVVDARRGIGNARVFPAGPLRAPLDAQLDRADAILVIGDGTAASAVVQEGTRRAIPIFTGALAPDQASVAALGGQPVLAFAGIADPDKFFSTLAAAGIDVRARRAFPDHHPYRAGEAETLLDQAERDGLVLLTTEKDRARMSGAAASGTESDRAAGGKIVGGEPRSTEGALAALAARARVLPVRLVLDEEAAFRRLVLAKVQAAR
jgi:tetraacyldisaccharide 4'-kinase